MSKQSEIDRLRRQQEALADFGTFAFREDDLQTVLTEAACICAQCLEVPFAKICRYRSEKGDLLEVAGFGGQNGVASKVVSKADETTTQGRAFITGESIILEDINRNNYYALPAFYAEHAIISTANVLIQSRNGETWGVLEVDSTTVRHFDNHDIVFLTGFANVIAEAVLTSEKTEAMRNSIDQMMHLIAEKNLLLVERETRVKELHELQSELLYISRLNAMGQMTAAIAHELNQPLAAIANYVGAAKLTLESENHHSQPLDYAQEMVNKAEEQTLRAGEVIKKLRDMVERRESVRYPENLESVIRSAMSVALFTAVESNTVVNVTVEKDLPAVLIDKVQIQQILFNLIRNSIEAMRDVKLRRLDVAIGLGEPGFVNVTIRDSGIGMPASVVERLFLPFVTTKDNGMGLGLMICRTLAEVNGGRIWRRDDVGSGTALCFCLPVAPDGVLHQAV